jgi:hypothetical protein
VWFRKPILLPSQVQLVVGDEGEKSVAALLSARNTDIDHLVLTVG